MLYLIFFLSQEFCCPPEFYIKAGRDFTIEALGMI